MTSGQNTGENEDFADPSEPPRITDRIDRATVTLINYLRIRAALNARAIWPGAKTLRLDRTDYHGWVLGAVRGPQGVLLFDREQAIKLHGYADKTPSLVDLVATEQFPRAMRLEEDIDQIASLNKPGLFTSLKALSNRRYPDYILRLPTERVFARYQEES